MIRGLSPYPGAITFLQDAPDAQIKILKAKISNNVALNAGELSTLDHKIIVGTSDGSIEIAIIQPAGKSAMKTEDYLRGHRDPIISFVS